MKGLIEMKIVMGLTFVFVGCMSTVFAANGDLQLIPYINPDGSTGVVEYYTYLDVNGSAPTGGWAVETSAGTKVPYMKLKTDYSGAFLTAITANFEATNPNFSSENRISNATAAYNCFAYATGKTGYWVNSINAFISDGDWTPSDITSGNRIAHKKNTGTAFGGYDHGSKIVDDTAPPICPAGDPIPLRLSQGKLEQFNFI
jgi:hypothetical protein